MDPKDVKFLIEKAKNGDIGSRNEFIELNRGFIIKISSYICKRSLDWSNDDELSIALMAFNEAIDSYDPQKGTEFTSYSKMIIHNRLIDYFRKNNNLNISLSSIDDEELSYIEVREAINNSTIENSAKERASQIKLYCNELSLYGLSMADLTKNCPKHKDTRKMLFEVADKCSRDEGIIRYLKKNKMLSINEILKLTGVKRKFLEQWRKYLIALIIILWSEEYLYIKEYIDFKDEKVVVECSA